MKTMTYIFIVLALILFFVFVVWRGYVYYSGPSSDHFDGGRFHNQEQTPVKSLWSVLYWRLTGDRQPWATVVEPMEDIVLPGPTNDTVVVTFINHASSLIQTGKINILTDPQYNERASPVSWAGPARVHAPGVPYEKLPKIDVVIISHDHYDHMDEFTLKKLQKDHNPLFLVGLGNDAHLKSFGITEKVITLDWWQLYDVDGAEVTFVPAQHFSGRGLFDRDATLWGGYVIKIDHANLFFAGDTGYGPHFKEIQKRFGSMDLSMIPIGAYAPRWFMKPMHVNPEEAVLAHVDLQSKKSFGIHFKTFQLTDEPYDQPVIDLEVAKKKYNIDANDFIAPEFGQSFIVSKVKKGS